MASVSTSTTLPPSSGLACQLVFLQFLNQLRTQHNITTQKDVQRCVESFELVDQLLKQEICPEERDYHTLFVKHVYLENSYYSSAKECDALEERLQEYEEKLNERTQTNERSNFSWNDNGTINQILTKIQEISSNQSIRKHIYMVENLLSLTKETIHMYATQGRTLENQRKKIQGLEKRNAQTEDSLSTLQKQQDEQNKTFEMKLLIKDDELKNKDQVLKMKDNELKNKDQELKMKDNELKQKDNQLQLKDNELNNKDQVLKEKDEAAKQPIVIARKRITKVIEFTNKYRKYLASGTFNFAVEAHGDTEIKDIFRPLQDIFGKTITEQEVRKKGYDCENGIYIPRCFECDGIDDCGNQKDETDCYSYMFQNGARVMAVRDWDYAKWGGEPLMLGTVTRVEWYSITIGIDTELTEVEWDNGNITEHRRDSGGKFELRAVAGYFCNRPDW